MTDLTNPLAILGGNPAFTETLHVGRPNIGSRESLLARISDMLDRRWLTNNGPYVQELEQRLQELLGVKHCIAMCNATVALEIAIRALDMKGEVIVPSFTFIATAHALQWQEITPIFCDIDPETHNLDPDQVLQMITPRTSGIIGVHLWGRPCPVDRLTEIARERGLPLLFDAAHAFGCTDGGRYVGNFGDAEVFSFHATKFFNAFEGGAITTNNDALAAKIRLMKNFGFKGYDNVSYIGTNGKMSEASAAMALTSLESLDIFIQRNKTNYLRYKELLGAIPGIRLIDYDLREKTNFQYIATEVDEEEFGLGRDDLLAVLHAENVFARRYFYPGCHRMEPYRSWFPHAGKMLPETEALTRRTIVLPTGTAVDEATIDTICTIICQARSEAAVIRAKRGVVA